SFCNFSPGGEEPRYFVEPKAFGPIETHLFPRNLSFRHAGGEEIGYFAQGEAGSNPAFDATYRGGGLARAVASRVPVLPRGRACVGVNEPDPARSPALRQW